MIKKFIIKYHFLIYIGLSFYLLDIYLRYKNLGINFGSMLALSANLFTLAWVSLLLAIITIMSYKIKKYFYLVIAIFLYLMFFINYIHYELFNSFFEIISLSLSGDGANYFSSIFSFISPLFAVVTAIFFILTYIGYKYIPAGYIKTDRILAIVLLVVAILSFASGRKFLGEYAPDSSWDEWNYKRNVYDNFMESRKSFQVAGFYEYVIRDIYITYLKDGKVDLETIEYLQNHFDATSMAKDSNDWTGIFKDKNIILVLMESIDDWLVTEDIMPTVNKMMNEGINFTNHFSPIYAPGATFNTEFMVNTGYMTLSNYGAPAYTFNKNKFTHSLPRLFKEQDYAANVFHLNYGKVYNRTEMTRAFGYDNYYGSFDMEMPLYVAVKDSHFMTESVLSKLILPEDKFMSFIITYSAHMPYTLDSGECQLNLNGRETTDIDNEEVFCISAQAFETDTFFKLLVEELRKTNKLDNTVIVAYTDHYAYGFSNKKKLYELKGTKDRNLLHKTPFFIWHDGIEKTVVSDVSSTIDILPTVAELFGLNWDTKNYIGKNIFDTNYDGFVFFKDYSWYDGDVYFKNNKIELGPAVGRDYINKRNKQIDDMLKLNKGVLETNYFNR